MTDSIATYTSLRRSPKLTLLYMLGMGPLLYFMVFMQLGIYLSPSLTPFLDGSRVLSEMTMGDRMNCAVYWHVPFSGVSDRCDRFFEIYGINTHFDILMMVCAIGGLSAGGYLGWRLSRPSDRVHHIRGRQLLKDHDAEKALMIESGLEDSVDLKPLQVTDYWSIADRREVEHFLDIGGSGSGKSQLLVRLFAAAINRGDRLVLHDVKGDYVSYLPDAFLLSPTDGRSGIWDIAADLDTEIKAREFIQYLIPHAGKGEKIWVNAARSIATGYLVYLIKTKGRNWTWADAAVINTLTFKQLKAIMREYWREAHDYLMKESVTSQGFISELKAHLYVFTDIANGWSDRIEDRGDPETPRPKLSLTQWLTDPQPDQQVLILARNSEFSELSKAWISAAVHFMATLGTSPIINDDRHRRIWFGLDEFWALQKQDKITELIRLGRSKGLIVVIGAQSTLQLEEIYGEKVVGDWFNSFGTVIVSKHKLGVAADKTASMIGRRQIEKVSMSVSGQEGDMRSVSLANRGEMENTILAPQLHSLLGPFSGAPTGLKKLLGAPNRPFIRIIVLGYGEICPIVRIPILDIKKFQKPYEPARWLNPGEYEQADELAALPSPDQPSNPDQYSFEETLDADDEDPTVAMGHPEAAAMASQPIPMPAAVQTPIIPKKFLVLGRSKIRRGSLHKKLTEIAAAREGQTYGAAGSGPALDAEARGR